MVDFENLELITKRLKHNMLRTIDQANTGHLGACCSSNELISVLYFSDILQINSKNSKDPRRDFVLVRGHVGPLRYNLFSLLGWMSPDEMSHYREYGSRLQGHEDMNKTPGVDLTPSGSLGMLLSYAIGARFSFRQRNLENRMFCFLRDGEEQEGNISEAARHASNICIDNLIVIIDKNTKQLSAATNFTDKNSDLSAIWKGYGWQVLEIKNGHDLREIYEVYQKSTDLSSKGPVCVIANTIKGNGIRGAEEHYCGYHVYHNDGDDQAKNAPPIKEEMNTLSSFLEGKDIILPEKNISGRNWPKKDKQNWKEIEPEFQQNKTNSYDNLEEFLAKLSVQGIDKNIYVLTADYPPRGLVYGEGKFSIPNIVYSNVGIREQHLLSMAHGISVAEPESLILILCGDAFVYRFADQMNVLSQSNDHVIIYSVQAGLSGAKNGSTHQSSGQSGVALTMPRMNIYEPSSKLDWFYVMNKVMNESGPSFIRTHKTTDPFDFGGFKKAPCYQIHTDKSDYQCTIATTGMITSQAFDAAKKLLDEGINTKLVNVLDVKRPDGVAELIEEGKPLFIFYNGNSKILSYPITNELIKMRKYPSILVERGFDIGTTGSMHELLKHCGLDSDSISDLIKKTVFNQSQYSSI